MSSFFFLQIKMDSALDVVGFPISRADPGCCKLSGAHPSSPCLTAGDVLTVIFRMVALNATASRQ
jgi:hypothetical protein